MNQKSLVPFLIVFIVILLALGGYSFFNRSKPLTPTSQPAGIPSPPAQATPVATASTQLSASVELARQDLAKNLNIDPSQISVLKIEKISWNDGSLGCPEEGKVYIQVIIPGYKVIFAYNQKVFEYHTDGNNRFVTCQPK